MGINIITDPQYGYKRVDPLPTDQEITEYYRTYYERIRNEGCSLELQRFLKGGKEAEAERQWLRLTLYEDIAYLVGTLAPNNRVLDVGCGTGELLLALKEGDLDVMGTEFAPEAIPFAQKRGLNVTHDTLESLFVKEYIFDAITLINVLEHVADPANLILQAKRLLSSRGIIIIRVPNDFNEMQITAQNKLDVNEWWVSPPEHLNYFDFDSISALLDKCGFDVIYKQSDFPMEMFLLMGDSYLDNREMGTKCHIKRRRFELALTSEFRRNLYQHFAKCGVGRSCLIVGRLK